jgi:plastocyanin
MKKLLFAVSLMLVAETALAKEVIVNEVTGKNGEAYFSPDKLTVQPGDTVTFVNAQDDTHEVMFVSVPKGVNEMIMSPMHEKKGDKFSYSFTVPGTYEFHCHPHEAIDMKGTLIVGKASKPGETKAMDHHKMAEKLEEGETAAKTKPASASHH